MAIKTVELSRAPQLDLKAPIRRRDPNCIVPLTDNQTDYWHRVARDGIELTTRLRAAAVRIIGSLDMGVLQDSVESVVRRHESLRTQISSENGVPTRQRVLETCGYYLETIDLSASSQGRAEKRARHLAQEFFARKVDLLVEPLFAAAVLKLSRTEHVLLLGLEHMVGDGLSCGILSKEIWAAYQQISQGLPLALPTLPIQFGDYAVWEQQTYEARRDKDEAYWSARTTGAPCVQIPVDPRLTVSEAPVGAILNVPFGKELSNGLRETAQRERTLLPIAVLTVHLVVLSHWCKETDWHVLFVSHGRYGRVELQNMVGFFSRALHLRIEVSRTDSLGDLLRRAHLEFLSASEHKDLVPRLPPKLNTVQVFNWGGMVTYSARWSVDQQRRAVTGLRIQPFPVDLRANHEFYPNYSETPAGIVASVHYRPDLVSGKTVERLGHNMRLVVAELQQRPLACIGSLPLV